MLGFHSIESGTINRFQSRKKKAVPTPVPKLKPPVKWHPHQPYYMPTWYNLTVKTTTAPEGQHPPGKHSTSSAQVQHPPGKHSTSSAQAQRITSLENEVNDLRQLVAQRQEDDALNRTMFSEMSALKQRLKKAVTEAEKNVTSIRSASVPGRFQQDLEQVKIECNWLYCTVSVPRLFYYETPTTTVQPAGSVKGSSRILVLFHTVENDEGLWMQTRDAREPEKRWWIRLTDTEGNVTIGNFSTSP